jgi:hypothetical protein
VSKQDLGASTGSTSLRSPEPLSAQSFGPPGDDPARGMVLRLARIIDNEAWLAREDGRDVPGTVWWVRREWALDRAEECIRALAKPTEAMGSAGMHRLSLVPEETGWPTLVREACAIFLAMLVAALDRDSDSGPQGENSRSEVEAESPQSGDSKAGASHTPSSPSGHTP